MKKIIRLTESQLTKLVKKVIKESTPSSFEKPNDDVLKVINTLEELGWIEDETTNVYKDHFEIYSIVDEQFDYFEMGNFLIIDVETEDEYINLFVRGEDYGEEEDIEAKKILMEYLTNNWDDTLLDEGIVLFVDEDDDDLF